MPPSALDHLSKWEFNTLSFWKCWVKLQIISVLFLTPPAGRLNITYPMLFKLTNKNSDRMTHCGVLEFVADEGICYLPHWVRVWPQSVVPSFLQIKMDIHRLSSWTAVVVYSCMLSKIRIMVKAQVCVKILQKFKLNKTNENVRFTFLSTKNKVIKFSLFCVSTDEWYVATDDAESSAGGRWSGPSWER